MQWDCPDPVPGLERASQPEALQVAGPGAPGRQDIERFIEAVYRRRFGATVRTFAPRLVCLRMDGAIVAAAGYRPAADGALFLERYLEQPVERLIPGSAPARRQVVEVGHFCAMQAGAGRRLIPLLAAHLAGQGYEWIVGTFTRELRTMFARMGLLPLTLGPAAPERLGSEAEHWGDYYAHAPVVVAGSLQAALRRLAMAKRGAA